nr:MAG TPA: hypothetical protein [Caudoviricetes sp.]
MQLNQSLANFMSQRYAQISKYQMKILFFC